MFLHVTVTQRKTTRITESYSFLLSCSSLIGFSLPIYYSLFQSLIHQVSVSNSSICCFCCSEHNVAIPYSSGLCFRPSLDFYPDDFFDDSQSLLNQVSVSNKKYSWTPQVGEWCVSQSLIHQVSVSNFSNLKL